MKKIDMERAANQLISPARQRDSRRVLYAFGERIGRKLELRTLETEKPHSH
jgi:hypothetical protein